MPRKPRRKSRNGMYHIMLRGINRQTIFEDEEDKGRLLETLIKYKTISRYSIYSYCFMDNHIHLLMRENGESLSKVIQRISASYVFWYNEKYERTGHLFQERYKSENVETTDYFLTVLRYIHQNPVKAGLVRNAFECKWTSLGEYIHEPNFIDIDLGLNLFSPEREKAIQLFADFMMTTNDDECLDDHLIIKMTDDKLRNHLNEMGITNHSALQKMDREKRDKVIKELKELKGVTLRQISRITGISKSVIQRVR
ncbi:REP element-mobilizing transposase RayT [Oceanobacillus limi]|uniref:REP element-mobilizing transposase RayT n=1 Tax=Oceanobacillus limi TaxID=930131 RepID=A0A1I0AD08_9BACI|nr:transposase [Oceanobacillus limi]SES91588.1 REP element-mobilizing transposase RayT [Oceanobacillus limi]